MAKYQILALNQISSHGLHRLPNARYAVGKSVEHPDAVLVRSGYHPVVAGPGYNVYYLNFLAGTSRTLAGTEDPNHVWLKSTWKEMDPRLPLVK